MSSILLQLSWENSTSTQSCWYTCTVRAAVPQHPGCEQHGGHGLLLPMLSTPVSCPHSSRAWVGHPWQQSEVSREVSSILLPGELNPIVPSSLIKSSAV